MTENINTSAEMRNDGTENSGAGNRTCWNCGNIVLQDEMATGLRGGTFCCEGCYGEYWCEVEGIEEKENTIIAWLTKVMGMSE